jgi:hypothetical protein
VNFGPIANKSADHDKQIFFEFHQRNLTVLGNIHLQLIPQKACTLYRNKILLVI